MTIGNRAGRAAVLAAALLLSLAGVAQAGEEAGGDITFRLVLRGEVAEGDAFSLGVNELAEPPTIIGTGVRCGPGSEAYNPQFVPCEAGTFEVVIEGTSSLPIGNQLEYAWARIPADAGGHGAIIYTDTITVTEDAQVFTVTYEYEGASGSDGGALPDTATPAAAEAVSPAIGLLPAGIAALIGLVVSGVLLRTGIVRRTAER